jgi:hypothetical protein
VSFGHVDCHNEDIKNDEGGKYNYVKLLCEEQHMHNERASRAFERKLIKSLQPKNSYKLKVC